MKLTPELLAQAKTGLNPIKERQLDLRGLQIPAIENLGASRDQHDSIDLTDNSITVLGNLPLVRRLRTLHLANNRIMSISPNLHLSCPGLNMLVLSNNNLGQLGDLEPLKELRYLRFLSLLGNPVREQKYYREWIIFRCKSLRVLDFTRIKDKERKQGETLFLTPDSLETALASQLAATVTTNAAKAAVAATLDEPRASGSNAGRAGRLMTAEEKARIKAAIARAASAEEIKALERKLREGWVPEG